MVAETASRRAVAGVLSALIPGLGLFVRHRWKYGLLVLLGATTLLIAAVLILGLTPEDSDAGMIGSIACLAAALVLYIFGIVLSVQKEGPAPASVVPVEASRPKPTTAAVSVPPTIPPAEAVPAAPTRVRSPLRTLLRITIGLVLVVGGLVALWFVPWLGGVLLLLVVGELADSLYEWLLDRYRRSYASRHPGPTSEVKEIGREPTGVEVSNAWLLTAAASDANPAIPDRAVLVWTVANLIVWGVLAPLAVFGVWEVWGADYAAPAMSVLFGLAWLGEIAAVMLYVHGVRVRGGDRSRRMLMRLFLGAYLVPVAIFGGLWGIVMVAIGLVPPVVVVVGVVGGGVLYGLLALLAHILTRDKPYAPPQPLEAFDPTRYALLGPRAGTWLAGWSRPILVLLAFELLAGLMYAEGAHSAAAAAAAAGILAFAGLAGWRRLNGRHGPRFRHPGATSH